MKETAEGIADRPNCHPHGGVRNKCHLQTLVL